MGFRIRTISIPVKHLDKLLLLLFLLSNSTLLGQLNEEHFIRYGKESGIPSNHVYATTITRDGRLWICTDKGVSRYNGYEFQKFDILDGLTDNEVFGIYEDSRGRIWMRTFSGIPCYYFKGKFYNSSNEDFLRKIKPAGFISSIIEDKTGSIYIGYLHGRVYKINQANQAKDIGCFPECRNWGLFFSQERLVTVMAYNQIAFLNSNSQRELLLSKSKPFGLQAVPIKVVNLKNGNTIVTSGRSAISIDQDLGVKETKEVVNNGKILEISEGREGSIYVGTTKGLYHFADQSLDHFVEPPILSGVHVMSIADCEKEGRWYGTSNGLIYQPDRNISEFGIESITDKITVIQFTKQLRLLAGTESGKVFEINWQNKSMLPKSNYGSEKIKAIYPRNLDEEWARSNSGLFMRHKKKVSKVQKFTPRDLAIIGNDSVCLCSSRNWEIKAINTIWKNNYLKEQEFRPRTYSNEIPCFEIHYTGDSTLWIYDALGVHFYRKGITKQDSNITRVLGNAKATKIESSVGAVFFATNGSGLIVKNGKNVFNLTKQTGLLDNNINDIYPDPVHGLWIAYSSGIQRLNWSDSTGLEIMNLPQGTIPAKGKEIIQVVADSTHLFVLTETSVFRVEKAQSDLKYKRLTSQILNVTLNDTASLDSSPNDLAHYENSFQFDFIAISFRAMGNVQYRYRLNGLEKKWSSTKARFAKYPSIPPGSYEFEVQAKVIGEEWGESTFFRTIRVLPPYWQTWWFRLAIILGIVLIAVIVLLLILRSNRRRNLLIQQTMLAKHKALITQMNPHFIFNSLNSIQRFFITNDLESANDYLVDFGNLIRIILENGRETNITLEKEVTLLDLYMKMEALRMRQKFDFEITHDGLDLAQVVIPPMLLQPFVENAIWHGVAGLKGHGHISINFHQVDDRLCVEIEDNGVGRPTKKVVKKGKSSVHQSLATRITKERIDLMKSDHPDQVLFKIVDLKDENNRPRGTLVKIQMPFETQAVIGGLKNESNTNR